MLTYTQLIQELQSEVPNPHYYKLLIEHSAVILLQVAKTNQGVVARDLNMAMHKLSNFMPMLKELA